MPHRRNIYAKTYDMAKAIMCAYSQSYHALPHWKCVWRCCSKFPRINLPEQETDDQYTETIPSIRFCIYHLITRCIKNGRLPLTDNKSCHKFRHDYDSVQYTDIYTRKELVMMETTISNFHTSFYIPAIQKLAFYIPQIQIMGTNHCGDSRRTSFKRCKSFQYVICCCDYSDMVVASFFQQIQS